jgi:hypothetical protein
MVRIAVGPVPEGCVFELSGHDVPVGVALRERLR